MGNLKLKRLIKESGFSQRKFAKLVSITEFDLSRAIHRRLILNQREKDRIASILNLPLDNVFDE
jgi:hypothetical protein